MTREEQWLGAIAGMDGVTPPSMPVWHYEQMLAAIYDAVTGASPAREFPERSWHLDEFLWAVYCAVAGLADPGIPAPTCRIEEFWRGIYLKAMNDEDAAVPTPVWRIEEFLAEVFNNLTTAELKTVTGTMLHVLDALAKPAEELLVDLSPIQDLHGYSYPWPAGGGKNKLLPNYSDGASLVTNHVTYTNTDGVVNVTGTPTGNAYYVLFPNTDGQRLPLPAGTYTISCQETTANCKVNFKVVGDVSGALNANQHSYTFTLSSDGEMFANILTNGNSAVNLTLHIQIESGSTATSWVPYENICPISGRTGVSVYVSPTQNQADATTYTVDWTTEAGTVYGGTIDVVTGVLTVDRAMVDLGTLNWGYSASVAQFRASLNYAKDATSTEVPNMKCEIYKTVSYAGMANNDMCISRFWASVDGINVKDSRYTDAATFKTAMSGVQLCYELATPLTYQLTAQEVQMLLGENYVWASSGDTVSVTYYAEGNANPLQSLNILLGGNYSNPKTADDVSDREALEIILGGNK